MTDMRVIHDATPYLASGTQLVADAEMLYIQRDQHTVPVCTYPELPMLLSKLERDFNSQAAPTRTPEGIDIYFRAEPGFQPSLEAWAEDSKYDWKHLSGEEMFNRYQLHAETYCWGCRDFGQMPTYDGFREWLIMLRESEGDA